MKKEDLLMNIPS